MCEVLWDEISRALDSSIWSKLKKGEPTWSCKSRVVTQLFICFKIEDEGFTNIAAQKTHWVSRLEYTITYFFSLSVFLVNGKTFFMIDSYEYINNTYKENHFWWLFNVLCISFWVLLWYFGGLSFNFFVISYFFILWKNYPRQTFKNKTAKVEFY